MSKVKIQFIRYDQKLNSLEILFLLVALRQIMFLNFYMWMYGDTMKSQIMIVKLNLWLLLTISVGLPWFTWSNIDLKLILSYLHLLHMLNSNSRRLENVNKFTENVLKMFLLSKGIIHQASCSYMPQQNVVVKRKHRHFLETARALHFQSYLPPHFLGWVHTLCYFLNQSHAT